MRASVSARLIVSASVSLSVLDADDVDLSVFSVAVSGIEVARREDGGSTNVLNETSSSDFAAEGRLPGARLLTSSFWAGPSATTGGASCVEGWVVVSETGRSNGGSELPV